MGVKKSKDEQANRVSLARCYSRELYRHWRNLEEEAAALDDLSRWMREEGFKDCAKDVRHASVDVLDAVQRLSDEEGWLLSELRSRREP